VLAVAGAAGAAGGATAAVQVDDVAEEQRIEALIAGVAP
jgi:hypothetical protein